MSPNPPDAAIVSFTAPVVGVTTTLTFQVAVTNGGGTSTASVTITVNATGAPTVNHIPAVTVGSGTPVTMTATGTDPAGLPLTFTWTQTAGTPIVLTPNPFTGATVSFTITLPLGAPATTLQFQVVATNSVGVSSAPEFTSVTVNPLADSILITTVEYRTGKQRLTVNATSSVVSPNVDLTLQPYVSTTGATIPGGAMTNLGGGLYQIVLVGVPQPAAGNSITVTSNLGGSASSAITRLRQ